MCIFTHFGYKSLDLFLNISSVDDESGPLHAVKKNDSLGVYSKSIYEITNPVRGERGKLDNKYVNEKDNVMWERSPMENLAKDKELNAYKHDDFWKAMDTLKDQNELNKLWFDNNAKWKIW